MSFRAKLAIAFSSILLLTAFITLTNWWGIGSAIQRQERVDRFTSDLEHQLHLIIRKEQAFRATETIDYSRQIRKILSGLKDKLRTISTNQSEDLRNIPIKNVLRDLETYENNFIAYSQSLVAVQTIKSRLLKESQGLLSQSGGVTVADTSGARRLDWNERSFDRENELFTLHGEIDSLMLAEKEFILESSPKNAAAVTRQAAEITRQAHEVEKQRTANLEKLKAFRIARAAEIYLDIFNRFVAEQKNRTETGRNVEQSLDNFSATLSSYLNQERLQTRKIISDLQILSIIISLLAVAIGIVAVFLLSNLISRPVNELRRSAQQIADGNLDTSVTVTANDDIGKLGSLFNLMASRLQESFKHIEAYRDHLKDLVNERTEKLENEIAQHKATEEALRSSSERLANIFDQSPVGIAIFDIDFNIIEWNPSCEKIFGFKRKDIIGQYAHTIVPEVGRQHVDNVFRHLLETRGSVKSQNENKTSDGHIITCEWYNTPLTDPSDQVIGMLSLVENVTEKIRLERELLKVKKLESTGVLAGGIAHDFNNILTAILGNLNLSLVDDSLQDRTRELLRSAEKATLRAQALTQQLLTFAKGGEPVKEQTSLVEMIQDSAEFVLHGSSSSCRYHFPEDLWLVRADKGQISQVVQNIVLNASQSMPGGGFIDIYCENVPKQFRPEGMLRHDLDYVKLVISDHGVGIPPTVLEKIFDPYFSTKKEGSGLGLAVTLSIINKHDGHVLVDSNPGSGTTFTIFLPADHATNTPPAEHVPDKKENRQIRVLLMDDDEMVRQVGCSMLTTLGHEVVSVDNGDECLNVYREQIKMGAAADLIILDLTIPGAKGGAETVKEVLELNPKARVIVSSGYSNDPIMAQYKEHGFCAAIAKPYVIETLAETIDRALPPEHQSGT